MKTIICLGPKACDIGEAHESLSEGLVIKLIDKDIEGDNCYSISAQNSPEEYEKNTPKMSKFFSDITDEVLFILSGESEVASCSLKILQQIKDKKITIVYLLPQRDFLTIKQTLQERMIRNVMQEYARSGIFRNIILLDSSLVENIMGETSIKNFDTQFSATIMSLLRTYRNLQHLEAIIDHSNNPRDISRIMTLGYYDLSADAESSAYNMKMIDDKVYHFFLCDETLNGDAKMLREIKDKLKNKSIDNTKISYSIYNSTGNTDFCYVVSYSKAIQ